MATIPAISNVVSSITSGNFSSDLSTTAGGASSIVTSLNGMSPVSVTDLASKATKIDTSNITDLAGQLTKVDTSSITDLAGKLPTIPSTSAIDSLKTITPPKIEGLAGLMDAAKGVSKSAFSAISGALKPLTAGVPQNLTAINLKNAADQAASDAAAAGGDIAAAVKTAAANIPGAATLASGIDKLPGGQSSIASLVNTAGVTTSGVTDTLKSLTEVTKNVSSAALNKISTLTASTSSVTNLLTGNALTGAGTSLNSALNGTLDSASNLASKITGTASIDTLTKGLQSGKQSLVSLVSSGLPAGAAASLAASMNSLSTSSPFPIKMPTIAEKTVDRSEVSTQINNLLGDKKVPSPNFTGTIAAPAATAYQSYDDRQVKLAKYEADRKVITDAQQALYDTAREAYDTASQTLPQGDPELHRLAQVAIEAGKKLLAIKNETYDGRLSILTA